MRPLVLFLLAIVLALPGRAFADTVAVLYFENEGNEELEQLKIGLAQMLITDLSREPGLQVVERARLEEVLAEIDLGQSGRVTPETAVQIGKLLQARWIVFGTYFEVMGTFRVDARIVEVETSAVLSSHGVDDKPQQFMALEKELAAQLAKSLTSAGQTGQAPKPSPSAGEPPSAVAAAPPAASTETRSTPAEGARKAPKASARPAPATTVVAPDANQLDAALAFSEGLVHLDKKDVPRAREAFEKALATDPGLEAARAELDRLEL